MRPFSFVAPWIASLALFAACSRSTAHPIEASGDAPHAAQRATPQGAPSIDALLDEFLAALEKEDFTALHELRVTRQEYQDIIIPGTVQKGQPLRQVSEKPRDYFWGVLDTKSHYFAEDLMTKFGGRHYRDRQVRFTAPPREYATYSAYGQVRLTLEGDDRKVYDLRTGYIAEIDGRYKFIGFGWND